MRFKKPKLYKTLSGVLKFGTIGDRLDITTTVQETLNAGGNIIKLSHQTVFKRNLHIQCSSFDSFVTGDQIRVKGEIWMETGTIWRRNDGTHSETIDKILVNPDLLLNISDKIECL